MKRQQGQSLMEIAVSMWLLSMLLIFMLNIIPQGYLTLRKSHQLDVATSLAIYRIEETSFLNPLPTGVDLNTQVALYDATYTVTREFYSTADPNSTDVVVTVGCADLTPVSFPFQVVRTGSP